MLFRHKKQEENNSQDSEEPRSTQIYIGAESTDTINVYTYVIDDNDKLCVKSKVVNTQDEIYKIAVDTLNALYPDAILNTGIEHEYIRLADIISRYLCNIELTIEEELLVLKCKSTEGFLEPLVSICEYDVDLLRADY